MFDHVNMLLTSFAPRQIKDSSISTEEFIDREPDRPNNRLLASISAFVILLVAIGGVILLSYVPVEEAISLIVGAMTLHILMTIGYLSLRRLRRRRRALS